MFKLKKFLCLFGIICILCFSSFVYGQDIENQEIQEEIQIETIENIDIPKEEKAKTFIDYGILESSQEILNKAQESIKNIDDIKLIYQNFRDIFKLL